MDETVLADVQIPRSGPAAPLVRPAVGQVRLKTGDARIQVLEDLHWAVDGGEHFVEHKTFGGAKRLQPAGSVMDDSDRSRKSQFARSRIDGARVVGALDATANDRIDIHVESRVVAKVLQLLVEKPEALLRDLVRLDVVDANLEKVEPGFVECLYPPGHEEVAVGDQTGHHASGADVADQVVEFGMQHRFAPAEGHDRCSELREVVDAAAERIA